ncbi:MAG: DUF4335 domain-containing protein [Leptolyngbya sp. IPPAS B-1204]|nr:DUF4335 domain-containing protein [Elainella sp. C42_A2020_010]
MPTAVLRRYTPPTCTLEIAAARSALSRWTELTGGQKNRSYSQNNRTVLKDLRFHLSFDDPKLPPEHQVTVSGNQTQLEALYEVVSTYVQSLLATVPEQIPWETSLRRTEPTNELTGEPTATLNQPVATTPEQMGIALQPTGLLSHDLKLGSLATEESGPVVHLTTLQLFDLANALEAYNAEALTLPTSQRPAWLKVPQGWASIAAVSVLALAATGGIAKFVIDVSRPTQTASAPRERQVDSELNSDLFPTLSPPPVEASPSITLQPLPPPPPSGPPQSSSPGLPPVGVTQAPPAPAPAPAPASDPSGQQQVTVIPDPNSIASAPSQSLAEAGTQAEPQTGNSAPPRLTGTEEAPETASRALAPSSTSPDSRNTTTSSTAFDTIPQVAEIRSYFQQSWQPPEGLTQTLEYRLLLNANGSLQRIVPLGQASENYLDRTNMPLMGEPFVSPTGDGSTPQIRLVLKPNGTVQSFLEYAN